MKKKLVLIFFSIMILFSGCQGNNINFDATYCYYNDNAYSMNDTRSRRISSSWEIPDAKSKKVKVNFKDITNENLEISKNAKVYYDSALEMFLKYDDTLYVRTDYVFPDLQNGDKVEKIIIMTDENENFFDENCISITSAQDIENIQKLLLRVNNCDYNSVDFSKEKPRTTDLFIGIKFFDFPAIYDYGYLSICENNSYGIHCYDNFYQNYLFVVDNEEISVILDKVK